MAKTLRERLDERDFSWTFSRSGGPGGQNVNKVSSRVTLIFDLNGCKALTIDEKQRLASRLRRRISREGMVRLVSARYRSQSANRRDALERFYELVSLALRKTTPRKPTKTPKRAHRRRLLDKARCAQTKSLRRKPLTDA